MTTQIIRKSIAGAFAALVLGGAVIASSAPASAGWRASYGWGVAAGVAGGMALGALAAQAARPAYYYGEPTYYGPCYTVRQRVMTDYGWRTVRRRVCE